MITTGKIVPLVILNWDKGEFLASPFIGVVYDF